MKVHKLTEDQQFRADVRRVQSLIQQLEAARPALKRLGVIALSATLVRDGRTRL